MGEPESVLTDEHEGILTLTLNRGAVHNAFDERMIARLSDILGRMHKRDDLRVVILKGAGPSFSAGADLNWMKRAASFTEQQNKADALALADMLHKLYTLPQMTIACVQGAVMGGGLGLVSCCDIVIADKDSVFALSEVRLGLIPATIAPYVLRAIGTRQARRYFQTGERFGSQQAHHLGLVHEIVDGAGAMQDKLGDTLKLIPGNGPKAMRAAKQLCAGDLERDPVTPAVMNDTATKIAQIRATAEAKEGLSAFLEKRKAAWPK